MDLGLGFFRCFAGQLNLCGLICNADILGVDAASGYAALIVAVIAVTY